MVSVPETAPYDRADDPGRVGPYRILQLLGEGGMGVVYEAEQLEPVRRRVALKLIKPGVETREVIARFEAERQALAVMTHESIAKVLDAGTTASGQPFFAMELVRGVPITEYCDVHRLSTRQRIELFIPVCRAVQHAHQKGVIHRDLKPSNVLVEEADGGPIPKIIDFGIAKATGQRLTDKTLVTAHGVAIGTPAYMSPEQAEMSGLDIDTRSDVYSLGVMLYELLVGRLPYEPEELGVHAFLARLVSREMDPPTPSTRVSSMGNEREALAKLRDTDPDRLRRQLRGDLDWIVMRAMEPDRNRRYETVNALALDLESFLADQPVQARAPTPTYRMRKFVRRHTVGVAASLAVLLTLIGATVFSLRQMQEARQERDAAVHDAKRSQALVALQTVLAGDARGADGRQLALADRIALAEQVLKRQFGREPWLVSEVMTDLAGRFYDAGDLAAQRGMLARARAVARDASLDRQIALANCQRVYSFAFEDLIDSGRVDMAEAKAALARAGKYEDSQLDALCLDAEGQLLVAAGQPDSGIALLRRAVPLVDNDPNATTRLQVINDLAAALRLAQRNREAVPYVRRVVAELDSTGYAETEALPNVLSLLANTQWELGEFATTDSELAIYVRQQERLHGQGSAPKLLAFLYAQSKLHLGELDSADVWLGRVVRDTATDAGWVARWLPTTMTELRLDQGRLAGATRASAEIQLSARGARAVSTLALARVRRARGDAAGAARLLEQTLDSLSHDGKPALPYFTLPFVTAGEWRLASGDVRGADSLAQLAVNAAHSDSLSKQRSGFTGRAELFRGRTLLALHDTAGARAATQRALVALENGYGAARQWPREARALLDSLSR